MKKEWLVKGRNFIRRNLWQTAALALTCVVLCIFVSQKEGYHMDELLSFELANAEFNPWIVPTQPEGRLAKLVRNEIQGDTLGETLTNLKEVVLDALRNRGNSILGTYKADVYEEPVWISGEQFRDYITVGKGDAFAYLSVYFNVKDDNHPPLHFMLLHTMSSLWKGRIFPFLGCVINIGAVLGCMLLMMKLGRLLDRDGTGVRTAAGLAGAVLYGLSSGAIATTLLIRMYGLMTFLCMALFYQHVSKWINGEWNRRNKLLICVTVLGFWTQYFFLFYCLVLAAVTAFLLLRDRRWKELGGYVRSMLLAAVIGVAGFPFAVADVFSSGRGVEALGNLSSGFDGYGMRLAAFGRLLLTGVGGSAVLGGLLCGGAAAVWAAGVWYGGRLRKEGKGPVMDGGPRGLISMLLLPPLGYFLLAARMSPYLVDRYIMAVFPFVMMALGWALVRGTAVLARKAWPAAVCTVTALICVLNIAGYNGEYLYRGYEEQERTAREYAGLPCICVYDGVGYYENLVEFTYYGSTLLTRLDELEARGEKASIEALEEVVVLIKGNADRERTRRALEDKYGLYPVRELVADSVYGDTVWLYGRNG